MLFSEKEPGENYNILQLYHKTAIAGQPGDGGQMKYDICCGVQLLSENTLELCEIGKRKHF